MSELSETEEPDSTCGWPLMAAVRPAIETQRLILRLPVDDDAETIAGRIRAFVASETDPEIEGPVIIRGPDDRHRRRVAEYTQRLPGPQISTGCHARGTPFGSTRQNK